jgi:hypothetical protein
MTAVEHRDARHAVGILLALLALLSLGLWASSVWGQTFPASATTCQNVSNLQSAATSFASATSTSTAAGLPSIPTNAFMAVVTITPANFVTPSGIIYRDDGGTPTLFATPSAVVGQVASLTSTNTVLALVICQPQLKRFSFISTAAGAALLNVSYYTR